MKRFWSKVELTGLYSCWEWLASKQNMGYGLFSYDGTMKLAHRVAYTLVLGPIPKGLVLDHLCRNKTCVNPLHLEAVTQKENVRRGNRITKYCPAGHARTPDNLRGYDCKRCRYEQCKAQYKRDREKINARRRELYYQRKTAFEDRL